MYTSFKDEYNSLVDLAKYKKYRRYGKDLYVRENNETDVWKPEYNISEFTWGFCKSPCYAKRLTDSLEQAIPDHKKYLKTVAKSNKNVSANKLHQTWESAISVVQKSDKSIPLIVYSTENSHIVTDKTVFCNDVDGEFWHGILLSPEVLANLDNIIVSVSGIDFEGNEWCTDFIWHVTDIKRMATQFNSLEPMFYFSPFKHPVLLFNSSLSLNVSFNFIDGRLPSSSCVKMVYGVCNAALEEWLTSSEYFTTELAFDRKLVINKGRCRELSVGVNRE